MEVQQDGIGSEELSVPLRLHGLLLALAGRLDDSALSDARELTARSHLDEAAELAAGALIAGRIPVHAHEQRELAVVLEMSRSDPTLADQLLVDDVSSGYEHQFSGADEPGDGVAAAVDRTLQVLPGLRSVHAVWRNTPAGSVPGPLPQRVILVEIDGDAHPPAVAYRVDAALRRAGIRAAVEVDFAAVRWSGYHRSARASGNVVWLASTSPEPTQLGPSAGAQGRHVAPAAEPASSTEGVGASTPANSAIGAAPVHASGRLAWAESSQAPFGQAAPFDSVQASPASSAQASTEALRRTDVSTTAGAAEGTDSGSAVVSTAGQAGTDALSRHGQPASTETVLSAEATSEETTETVRPTEAGAADSGSAVASTAEQAGTDALFRHGEAQRGRAATSAPASHAATGQPVSAESGSNETTSGTPVSDESAADSPGSDEPAGGTAADDSSIDDDQDSRSARTADMTAEEVTQLRTALAEAEDAEADAPIAPSAPTETGEQTGASDEVVEVPDVDLNDPNLSDRDRRLLRELHAELAERERAEASKIRMSGTDTNRNDERPAHGPWFDGFSGA